MIKDLVELSKKHLDNFYNNLELAQWEHVLNVLMQTRGHIYLTGIGKSGYIAKKIAMTLVSIGTKSSFLDPLNLLHGDLGMVDADDVILVMSKSGFTKELLDLIPFIKKRGAKVIGCVSSKDSPLERLSDSFVYLPVVSELDPNNLVPTVSTQVQLIFGDILTIAVMKQKGIGLDTYATFHPAGSIGKKLLTKVDELMLKESEVPYCRPQHFIKDILVELSLKKCGCVVVVDEKKALKGIFTDGDLRRSLQFNGPQTLEGKVSDLMSKEAVFIEKSATAFEAKKLMQRDNKSWINVLPIIENDQVVGLLRMHDILNAGI